MVKNRYNSLIKKWQNSKKKTSLKKAIEKIYRKEHLKVNKSE